MQLLEFDILKVPTWYSSYQAKLGNTEKLDFLHTCEVFKGI